GAHTLHVGHDAGRVGGGIAELFAGPDGLPGHLVEGGDTGMIAAGGDDEVIAIDERRLAEEPVRIASLELLQDILPPDLCAILSAEARQLAILGENVEAVAIGGRGAAGAGAAVLIEAGAER